MILLRLPAFLCAAFNAFFNVVSCGLAMEFFGAFGLGLFLAPMGLVAGAAARQALPVRFKRGRWILAGIGAAAFVILFVLGVARPSDAPSRIFLPTLAAILLPPIVASSLNSNRWILLGAAAGGILLGMIVVSSI